MIAVRLTRILEGIKLETKKRKTPRHPLRISRTIAHGDLHWEKYEEKLRPEEKLKLARALAYVYYVEFDYVGFSKRNKPTHESTLVLSKIAISP